MLTPTELNNLRISVEILRRYCVNVDDCPQCVFWYKDGEFCKLFAPPYTWYDEEIITPKEEK